MTILVAEAAHNGRGNSCRRMRILAISPRTLALGKIEARLLGFLVATKTPAGGGLTYCLEHWRIRLAILSFADSLEENTFSLHTVTYEETGRRSQCVDQHTHTLP